MSLMLLQFSFKFVLFIAFGTRKDLSTVILIFPNVFRGPLFLLALLSVDLNEVSSQTLLCGQLLEAVWTLKPDLFVNGINVSFHVMRVI